MLVSTTFTSTYLGFLWVHLSLHQLNLGVSDITTNIDTEFLQPDDGIFQRAAVVLKGGKFRY